MNVLFIANALLPTLQVYFLKPLAPLIGSGHVKCSLLTETQLKDDLGGGRVGAGPKAWIRQRILDARPDIVVACRYSGPCPEIIIETCRELDVPLIVHVDDDLLNIPRELGEKKYAFHNSPKRLATVRTLLDSADLIYCSTEKLERRLRGQGFRRPIRHGAICCASRVRRRPGSGPVRRLGYMGFDHAHDFEIARPAIEAALDRHPGMEFELFGPIPMPDSFARFGERTRVVPPVRDYQAFLQALADRAWDIGICPLARTPFNAAKSDIKWVEYTAAGMAVIASGGMVYDHCMRDGRGLLVDDDEWEEALELLISRPDLARAMAEASQRRLLTEYSESALSEQVTNILGTVLGRHASGKVPPPLASCIRTVA